MERLSQMNIVVTLDHNGEAQTRRDFCDNGEYCRSADALALIAELQAEVARGEIYYRRLMAEYQEAVRDSR